MGLKSSEIIILKTKISTAGYLLSLLISIQILSGCAAYTLDNAQHSLRDNFSTGNFEDSVELLEKMEQQNVYKEKDEVLLNLELGLLHHFSGNYDESNLHLSRAELAIEDNFTRSITRGISSMLISDNQLVYAGEDYEDVYINVFKSLNYIHQNDYEAALVEARRIAFKLEGVEIRNRGLAEMFSRADSLNQTEWKTGERVVENSALAHYLSAVLFAKTGRPDNARIEYERMIRALDDQSRAFNFTTPPDDMLNKIRQPEQYNVLITGFSGRSPMKVQHDVRTFVGSHSTYLKFSLPELKLHPSSVHSIEIVTENDEIIPTFIIEEMDRVAADVYKVKEPIIYARAFTRSALKAFGSRAITKEAQNRNEGLGLLAWLFGFIGQEITEKADLRGWQTLPGKAHVNVAKFEPGVHEIKINYYSGSGRLLFTEEQTIEVFPGNDLTLVQSLFWH